jgi:hypothetical protein
LPTLVALALMTIVPAGACVGTAGEQIVLASTSPDPDVFVWDTRVRLSDYAAGAYEDAKTVMAHTSLVKPGTRAVVLECRHAEIHQRYVADPLDAVSIKVVSGPLSGKTGWVTSEDVHVLRGARTPTPPKGRS